MYTFSSDHRYIVVNELHQLLKEYIHRYLSKYIQQVGQLDLIDAYFVEVVSFELENKVYANNKKEKKHFTWIFWFNGYTNNR